MNKPLCQSCAMPLESTNDMGTNEDKSKNNEYCHYCFKDGKFTNPNITLDEMLTKVVNIMKQANMTKDIITKAQNAIPTLKRWKQ